MSDPRARTGPRFGANEVLLVVVALVSAGDRAKQEVSRGELREISDHRGDEATKIELARP